MLGSCACTCRTGAAGCGCSTELEPISLHGLEGERALGSSYIHRLRSGGAGKEMGRAGGMASAWASRTSTNWLLQNTYNTDMKLPAHTQREAGGRDHGGVGRLLTAGRLGAPLPIYLPLTRTRHEETNQGREGHEAGGSVSLMGNFDSRARNIDGVLRHGQSPL